MFNILYGFRSNKAQIGFSRAEGPGALQVNSPILRPFQLESFYSTGNRSTTSWEIAEQGRECQFPTPALESSMGPSQFDHEKLEGLVVLQRIEPGKAMLVRVVAMLTKLLERFDPEQFRVRESPSDSVLPFESRQRQRCERPS